MRMPCFYAIISENTLCLYFLKPSANLKRNILVSTNDLSRVIAFISDNSEASHWQFSWSILNFSFQSLRFSSPACAIIPAYLRLPPSSFRSIRQCFISFAVPTITDPIGQPRPLLMQTETVSKSLHISAGDILRNAAALKLLAPSRCIFILCFFAIFFASFI